MDLPKPLLPGLPLTGSEYVRVRQGAVWVYPKLSDIIALATGPLTKALGLTNAAVSTLSGRADTLDAEAAAAATAISTANDAAAAMAKRVTALEAGLTAANGAADALAKRVATLESRPSVVVLTGSLPLSTLQIGTASVQVAVAGLLRTDKLVGVTLLADVPAGLQIGSMRPSTTADGILLVQAAATLSLSGKAALPLGVAVLR